MELIIKNDSNVKISICKDETIISSIVGEGDKSSSIVQKANEITSKVHIIDENKYRI